MSGILKVISDILLFILKALGIAIAPIIIAFILQLVYLLLFKKMRFKGITTAKKKKESFIKRVFILFPRQFWIDTINREPDSFRDYGVHIIAGEQGSGKTITLAYLLDKYQREYPKCKIRTNFNYTRQDGEINHWKDIVQNNNGIYGQIEVLDEIQNWFNSLQSKDFPVEMLTEITQQRKQRKIIFGTSQVFSRVAKPIREQTTFLYEPITILGCLTIVKKSKPQLDHDGIDKGRKNKNYFFFVHNEYIRNLFDTYRKVENLREVGFKSEADQLRSSSSNITIQNKKKGLFK